MESYYTKWSKTLLLVLFCAVIQAGNTPFALVKTLIFQENKGQISDQYYKQRADVLFSGSDGVMVYHLKKCGISYQLKQTTAWKSIDSRDKWYSTKGGNTANERNEIIIHRIDFNWLNCNTNAAIRRGDAIDGYENFYLESCPQGVLQVKSYKDITYQNLYPGIDLKWYEKDQRLKYDYYIAAGADYQLIKVELKGAQNISINASGQLVVSTSIGELIEEAPVAEQGGRPLPIKWKVNGNIVSFQIDQFDAQLPITIDPLVRAWGTFYGGTHTDEIIGSCNDINNNLLVTGRSQSFNGTTIATIGSYQVSFGGQGQSGAFYAGDSFLAKFNSAGIRQWATYYGGSGDDYGADCEADNTGNIYLVGGTTSTNTGVMSTPGSHQPVKAGPPGSLDAFIAKFDPMGFRIWSSYYGDVSEEYIGGLCIDLNGDVFFTGGTLYVTPGPLASTAIATPGSFQSVHGPMGTSNATDDAFLVKFSPTGTRLWGTYFGWEGLDMGNSCTSDPTGNVYMVGRTSSTTSAVMTTSGCHQSNPGSQNPGVMPGDGFIAKFTCAGARLWSTYYGGSGGESLLSCFVDITGNLYIGGYTETSGGTAIATPGSQQSTHGGGFADGFFCKFNSLGVRQWGSYYGGSGFEFGCIVGKMNDGFCVAGNSGFGWPGQTGPPFHTPQNAGTLIATPCIYQYNYGGGQNDAFLAKFDFNGNRKWGTYYGGAGDEGQECTVTVDGLNSIYLCGKTTALSNSSVMTSAGGFQNAYGGGTLDGFIAKFDGCIPTQPSLPADLQVCKGFPAVLNVLPNCSVEWYSDSLLTNLIFSGSNFTSNPIFNDTTFYIIDVACGVPSIKTVAHLTVVPGPPIYVNNPQNFINICIGEAVILIPSGADTYTWQNTIIQNTISFAPQSTTVYTVTGMLTTGGCPTRTTVTVAVNDCLGIAEATGASDLALQLYPNPSNESFILIANKPAQAFIYDEHGKTVGKIDLSASNQFLHIVKDLPSGIYFIRAVSESGAISKKITVLR